MTPKDKTMGEKVKLADLRPGQRSLLKVFEGGNADVLFLPSDPFDLRVCAALVERGVLQWWENDGQAGYELTPAGRAALEGAPDGLGR